MIKVCLSIFSVLLYLLSYSQSLPLRPGTLGLNYHLNDFTHHAVSVRLRDMNAGLGLSYIKGFTSRFDYMFSVAGAYPDSIGRRMQLPKKKSFLFQAEPGLRFRITGNGSKLTPLLSTALGAGLYRNHLTSYLSVGGGLEFSVNEIYITASFNRRIGFSTRLNDHNLFSLGIAGVVDKARRKAKPKPAPEPAVGSAPVADLDGDGISDMEDGCPGLAGLAKFAGCPDSDDDGIEDREDSCARLAGEAKYHGCPVPDSDKDGIDDKNDSCVFLPGVLTLKGCPVDTRRMEEQLNLVAQSIYFQTGSAVLEDSSYAALTQVVKILDQDSSIRVSIEGHTDDQGKADDNQKLSEQRARAVYEYLSSNGISAQRLTSSGFGESRPISRNKTAEGRRMNRRVVFVIRE